MKYSFTLLLLFVAFASKGQVFFTETFDVPACAAGSGCDPSIVGWSVSVLSAEGTNANMWYVSDREAGLSPPACGASGGGDQSMHIGNVSTSTAAILFCPAGDCGAAYDDSSPAEITDKRVESPIIDCSASIGLINLDFDYMENGEGLDDNFTLWYRDGTIGGWIQLDPMAKTPLTCAPQGQWTAYSIALPATSSGNSDVQFGFGWTNDGDGIASDPSCALDDCSLTLVAASPPVASFSCTDSTLCIGDCIDFTDLSTSTAAGGITAWAWDFGNTITSTLPNPTGICYTTAGNYTVTLTVTDADGTDTEILVDLISVVDCSPPVPSFSCTDSTLCEGDCIDFTDLSTSVTGSGITSWAWDFGNTLTSTLQNPTGICYSAAGNYTITLTVTDSNGVETLVGTDFISVVNCAPPVAAFSCNDSTLCEGDCIDFTDLSTSVTGSGITSWAWDFGNSVTSTLPNPTGICYSSAGDYTVTLTVTDSNGVDTDLQVDFISVINCNPLTASFAVNNDTVCEGGCVTFSDSSSTGELGGIISWEWSFTGGDPSSFSGQTPPRVCYNDAGAFSVQLIVSDSSSSDTLAVSSMVMVNAPVTLAVTNDTSITIGANVILAAAGGFTGYFWSPDDSLSCVACQSTLASPIMTTTYTVVAADTNGCISSSTVTVTVDAIGFADTLFIPNVFSPNGDGANDLFLITTGSEYSLNIFNRWGEVVYTSDYRQFWDGRTDAGELSPEGTYYYLLVLENGEVHKGHLTLVR